MWRSCYLHEVECHVQLCAGNWRSCRRRPVSLLSSSAFVSAELHFLDSVPETASLATTLTSMASSLTSIQSFVQPDDSTTDRVKLGQVAILGNSLLWKETAILEDAESFTSADAVLERADQICAKRDGFIDYRASADVTWKDLCLLRQQLQSVRASSDSPNSTLHTKVTHALVSIYSKLRGYDEADSTLYSICPELRHEDPARVFSSEQAHIDTLSQYLQFCAWTGRQTARAKMIAKVLPWMRADTVDKESRKLFILTNLIRF